ncbi:MAG: hypothetical protein Q8N28_02475 [bacterium]|nr:hypothetical protein [bacterium]
MMDNQAQAIEVDRSIPKIIVLAALGIIFSFFFGYFLKLFILESRLDFLLFSFLVFLSFLTVFLIGVFFIKSGFRASQIIFLESLAFLAAFYNHLSVNIAIGALASFLILLWANYSGRLELENMMKIRFWRVGKKVLPKAIAALALFIGIAYVSVGGMDEKEFFISQSTFEKMISPVVNMKIVQNFLPGFNLFLPVGELAKNLAVNQIEQNSQLKLLPANVKNQLINQSAKELEDKFSDFIGAPVNPKIGTLETLYRAMVKKFSELPENIRVVVPVGVAVLIFLSIISLALPIRWLATILAYFIYEICLALGLSVIMLEGRSREIIILK